jgi:deoxyadenosine/deoxycytidine kinase/NTP pyrophosphatase (non-canonical NTP hydrolase)
LDDQTLSHPWYIIIEGAIGVGKTTLARMLSQHFGTNLLLEVFEENPFLARFYEARAQYAFQTQMFFLLSRYRQQQEHVPLLVREGALFSDYMFDKDWLFAQLNLEGDEWAVYQQLHAALSQQISPPDLIVYLQADTETLMGRIAQRDRPYERDMDRGYIDDLNQVYDRFFPTLQGIQVLTIDTNSLNFVTDPRDFQSVVERIRSVLQEGVFQQQLPQFEAPARGERLLRQRRPLAEYQKYHIYLDRIKGFDTNLYFNYLCLSEEIGELGSVLADLWREELALKAKGQNDAIAQQEATQKWGEALESELADCMAYLLKLANYANIDLEEAYLAKMSLNSSRSWPK